MTGERLHDDDFDRAAACVRAHPHRKSLAAFAYDVLSTQAEGRSLFAGQKFMTQRAEGHAVDRELAATDLGNLLQVLERGPADKADWLLVASFAASGFDDALEAANENEQKERAAKLVSHLDFLELSTPYRVMPCIERLVSLAHKERLYTALADAVLHDDIADEAPVELARKARNAARIAALAAADGGSARSLLERVSAAAKDSATLALCRVHLPEVAKPAVAPSKHVPVRLRGSAATITRRPAVAMLRWLSGFALVHWAWRAASFLARVERDVELKLEGGALHIEQRTLLLGRTVTSTDAVYVLGRVSGAFRRARFALLRTLVGMLSLACGILLGGHLAFDAAHGGATLMLAAAACVVALGAGLDLALDVLGPAARGRVQVQIDLADARSIKVADVTLADADRFLEALRNALPARNG